MYNDDESCGISSSQYEGPNTVAMQADSCERGETVVATHTDLLDFDRQDKSERHSRCEWR